MKQTSPPLFSSLRIAALAACMACLPALADDYSDVSQLVRAGKLPEALSRAEQYLSSQPKDPQMRFIKGVIQRDSGKTAEAIATFTRLTEDYPELPEPYNNLAVIYAGQSQFDKARAALEMAIRTNPSYATAHENLGDIYAKLASQAYNKALQLDSNNPAVPPKLALIREIFGNAKGQRPATANAPASAPQAVATAKPVAVAVAPAPSPAPVVPAPVPPKVIAPTPTAPAASAPPVAVAPAADNSSAGADSATSPQAREVEAAVAKWASAWSARDVKAYLATYGKDFDPPGSMSRKAWEEERQQRITSKASISVKVDKLVVSVNGNRAVAKFRQDYKAGGLAVASNKTLDFAKVGAHWSIVKESVGN
jgi:tetratricopeptide (TPR) repeat protein